MLCTVFGGTSHDDPKYNHWATSAQHMRAVCEDVCGAAAMMRETPVVAPPTLVQLPVDRRQ